MLVGEGVYQYAGPVAKSCLNRRDREYGGWFSYGLLYNLYSCEAIMPQPGGIFRFPEASTDVSYMKLIHTGFACGKQSALIALQWINCWWT